MGPIIPAATGAAKIGAEAYRAHQHSRQEVINAENSALASDPSALADVIATREKARNTRFMLGCGAAVLVIGTPVVAGVGVAGFGAYKAYKTGESITSAISDTYDNVKESVGDWFRGEKPVTVTNQAVMAKITFPRTFDVVNGMASGSAGVDTVTKRTWITNKPIDGFVVQHEGSVTIPVSQDANIAPIETDIITVDGSDRLELEVRADSLVVALSNPDIELSPGDQEGFLTDMGGNDGTERADRNHNYLLGVLSTCKDTLKGSIDEGLSRVGKDRIEQAIGIVSVAAKEQSEDAQEEASLIIDRLEALGEQDVVVTYWQEVNGKRVEIEASELPLPFRKNPDGSTYEPYTLDQYAAFLGEDPSKINTQTPNCTLAPDAFSSESVNTDREVGQ